MFHKILIPLDGSSASEVALDYLEHVHPGEVLLVRVYSEASKEVWIPLPQEPEYFGKTECGVYLQKVRRRMDPMLTVSLECEQGDPADAILRLADSASCDLILMTSHGRRGVSRFLLGSVAERVTRHARCPVLLVGRQSVAPLPDPQAAAALSNAQALVEGCL